MNTFNNYGDPTLIESESSILLKTFILGKKL
jgi:hypothetical protein